MHVTRRKIQREVGEAEDLVARVLLLHASQQRPQPSEELLQRERLGQVVVGACIESGNPVGDARHGR